MLLGSLIKEATSIGGGVFMERGGGGNGACRCWERAMAIGKWLLVVEHCHCTGRKSGRLRRQELPLGQ